MNYRKTRELALVLLAVTLSGAPAYANLIVNGGFEASSDPVSTPPGWTNVGHSEGVIPYASFGPAPYEGANFYDLGGFGNANGPTGDGIAQTVTTVDGTTYRLDFGLSSENFIDGIPPQQLEVCFNGEHCSVFGLPIDGNGAFAKPFATQSLFYVADRPSTTISFIARVGGGNNDALIDGVIFEPVGAAVPEPTGVAFIAFGLAGLLVARRRNALLRTSTARAASQPNSGR